MTNVGVVAIGRNEGQRLRACLESALRDTPTVVYVDSGSSDGSVDLAKSLAAAVVGGLMLGYGARIAYGCNIGAFFSGIASASVHGWLWLVAAFVGNIVGTRLRPAFGLKI